MCVSGCILEIRVSLAKTICVLAFVSIGIGLSYSFIWG